MLKFTEKHLKKTFNDTKDLLVLNQLYSKLNILITLNK